jgi:hypothetical protein
MKTIQIRVYVQDDKEAGVSELKFEKTAGSEEILTLASAIGTIFLKSQEALAIATKKGRVKVALGRSKKK